MILVTGATGNVGREAVAQLIAAGRPVRVFLRDQGAAARWGPRSDIAVGDFRDPQSVARACADVQSVLLIAVGTDAVILSKLFDAIRMSGAPRIVFLSGSVADWPDSQIGSLFRDREAVVKNCGLPWAILRPCDFMSNTYQWTNAIKREGAVYDPLGGARVALIAPEDVAAVAVKCLVSGEFDGRTINLTGSEALSVPEQVAVLSQVLGKPIRCVDVSVQEAVENLIRSGMSETSARSVGEIYEREGHGEGSKITRDFAEITGKAPRKFRAWAEDHSEEFRESRPSR